MVGDDFLSAEIRILLGNELRSLWRFEGLRVMLVRTGRVLGVGGGWPEGLRAVRLINRYDLPRAGSGTVDYGGKLLEDLEEALEPKVLSHQVRTYVFGAQNQAWALDVEVDLSDSEWWDKARARAAERAYRLGTLVASEPEVLDELSRELFTTPGLSNNIDFGRGLASTWSDLRDLWDRLVGLLENAGQEAWDCSVLQGVLEVVHQRDESLTQRILNEAIESCVLRRFIAVLQTSVPLGSSGLNRLLQSLDFDDTPVRQFEYVNWYLLADQVGEPEVANLLLELLNKQGGAEIVLRVLSRWLVRLKKNEHVPSRVFKRVALLTSTNLLRHTSMNYDGGVTDVHLSEVLQFCLDEDGLPEEVKEIWDAYFDRVRTTYMEMWELEASSAILARKGTFRFLDGIFSEPSLTDAQRQWFFREGVRSKNPLSGVGSQVLMDWCRRGDYQDRLKMISQAIYPFEEGHDDEFVLSEQAVMIIEETRDPSTVLRNLSFSACNPREHSGSEAIAERCEAFRPLLRHGRLEVRETAGARIREIEGWAQWERERELNVGGSFE